MKKKIARRKCKNCEKECSRPEKKYCNNNCQNQYQNKLRIEKWLSGEGKGYTTNGQTKRFVRRFLIEKANNCCQLCGWNKKNPETNSSTLEIHHIDGDFKNNTIDNLQVLCPNCHSLTSSYKNLNKGNGRDVRR